MSRPVLIGSEVLVATPAAALVASVPAALRLANENAGFLENWLAAAGLLCPLFALSIAAARGARRASKNIARGGFAPFLVGAVLWALVSLPATAVLGAVLKANTHHRALAGATFAALALVVHLGAALVAWRVTVLVFARVGRPAGSYVTMALGGGVLALCVLLLAAATPLPALLVDGAFAFIATAAAALLDIPVERRADYAWVGSGAIVFVAAIGLVLVGRSPSLAQSVVGQAPVAGTVAEAVGLSPDR
jgi:hypothetical protein